MNVRRGPHQHPSHARDRRRGYELWVTCADCGDVVVRAELCELHARAGDFTIVFPCSQCARRDVVPVTTEDVLELVAAGFVIRRQSAAAELREHRPCGEPFAWDDLLAFHEDLASATDVVALLDQTRVR
ncbi:MAG TPA: hypothetical protein VFX21_07245 [Acidimicrobiia bacterium]|nr:hypothetical protein [Acidimicrobiia bacterium]